MADLTARLKKIRESVERGHFLDIPLLDEPQFTNADVEAVSYVTPTQLHNWVSRGWIKLSGANPGKGKRRLYTGSDAIAVAVASALQPFAMMQVAEQLVRVNQIAGRAQRLLTDPTCQPGYGLAILPIPEQDDYLYIGLSPENPDPEIPAYGFVALEIDELIIATVERLIMVLNGETVPARVLPKKTTPEEGEDEFLAFTGAAYRDESGNRIYRGLSLEESIEFERLKNEAFIYRMSDDGARPPAKDRQRNKELLRRNEQARFEYLGTSLDDPLNKQPGDQ